LIPLAAALLTGCATDEDNDGHEAEVDCNDTDATLGAIADDADCDGVLTADDCNDADAAVYPGATETIGDGVDSDCDGEDPAYPFVGDWTLTTMTASYEGETYDVLEYWSESGEISIGDDLEATNSLVLTYEGETEPAYNFSHSGTATPGSDPAAFALKATGTATYSGDSYSSDVDWDCVVAGTKITCDGLMTWTDGVDSYSIDCDAEFEAKAD